MNLFHAEKKGLENISRLMELIGNPHTNYSIIHVAGTNGKGSVSTKIAQGLLLKGAKVGLFTSPHLSTFRERIKINNLMISQEKVRELLQELFELQEKHNIPATFFETTTALALKYFHEEKIDYAVLEAGLGGRLDSTNFVTPLLSVITSIGMDHAEILGNTLEKITYEKAGIIKKDIPIVIGPHVSSEIILPLAKRFNSPFYQVEGLFSSFDEENSAIAEQALKLLNVAPIHIEEALKIKPSNRLELLQRSGKTIVLDVAHNVQGLTELFRALHHLFPHHHYRVLFGLSKTKDCQGCLNVLKKEAIAFYPVSSATGRCYSVENLIKQMHLLNFPSHHIHSYVSLEESFKQAHEATKVNKEILVVCGTFFIMSTIRQLCGIIEETDEYL